MLSLYIHIPFCYRKCAYCDFVSYSVNDDIKHNYVVKLLQEIESKSGEYSGVVQSVYLGGGTPTAISLPDIMAILHCVKANYNLASDAEITIEGNPFTFDKAMLVELKKGGFNRFSVGVQSFHDNELVAIDRLHSKNQAVEACNVLKEIFPNYSLDLMIGIPLQTMESLARSIEIAVSLAPSHISCYMLKLEEGTKLTAMVEKGLVEVADEDTVADMYDMVVAKLGKCGFNQYETSNFARNNLVSRHNIGYWNLQNYLGFGIASHSLYGNRRFFNGSDLGDYIENGYSEMLEEDLTEKDKMQEYIMLRLRMNQGIVLADFQNMFNCDFLELYNEPLNKMKAYLDVDNTHVAIKTKYFSVASGVMVEFM